MSNEFLGDGQSEDEGTSQESGSALRQFGKEQKARADKLERELNEFKAQLAKVQAGEIFTKLGVPEKVRKFYSGDPTEDAISAWVKENADVFGLETDSPATQTPEQEQQRSDLAQVQQAQQLGQDRSTNWTRDQHAQKRADLLANGTGLPDLNKVLSELGVPDLPLMAPQF